jgi:hypothetical protein
MAYNINNSIVERNVCKQVVDWETHCIVGWAVVWERSWAAMQGMVEGTDPATQYYSDGCATYKALVYYPGRHVVGASKSQTYSVEADNAELRHYLARLGHRSRCFSRSIEPLRRMRQDSERNRVIALGQPDTVRDVGEALPIGQQEHGSRAPRPPTRATFGRMAAQPNDARVGSSSLTTTREMRPRIVSPSLSGYAHCSTDTISSTIPYPFTVALYSEPAPPPS